MPQRSVDLPSLQMVLVFTANIFISLWDKAEAPTFRRAGEALIVLGAILFVYVLAYLRSGFFGETEPKLDHLITDGPYRFCRHPLYLNFIIIAFGLDLAFGSVLGVAWLQDIQVDLPTMLVVLAVLIPSYTNCPQKNRGIIAAKSYGGRAICRVVYR